MQQSNLWYSDLVAERRMRSGRLTISAMRNGLPIILDGNRPLVALSAETASNLNLQEIADLSSEDPLLLLGAGRARALSYHTAFPPETMLAFRIAPAALTPEVVRGMADPTAPQHMRRLGELAAVPMNADIAVEVAKRAQLLPALLVGNITRQAVDLYRQEGYPTAKVGDLANQFSQGSVVERVTETQLPLSAAPDGRVVVYRSTDDGSDHLALIFGEPDQERAPLVRIHSACFTGDVLGSLRCDCGPQLQRSVELITEEGAGVILYLAQEGRGIGLTNKLRSYLLQDQGQDTLEANHSLGWESDARCFGAAAAMLKDLRLNRIRLLSNNPNKSSSISGFGIHVQARVGHTIPPNGTNDRYLETKRTCCGHLSETATSGGQRERMVDDRTG